MNKRSHLGSTPHPVAFWQTRVVSMMELAVDLALGATDPGCQTPNLFGKLANWQTGNQEDSRKPR
jgi:hypothetical protein